MGSWVPVLTARMPGAGGSWVPVRTAGRHGVIRATAESLAHQGLGAGTASWPGGLGHIPQPHPRCPV